jgi:hypothetical protein
MFLFCSCGIKDELSMYAYRRKPAYWLGYMPGGVRDLEREGFLTICVHCVSSVGNKRCFH